MKAYKENTTGQPCATIVKALEYYLYFLIFTTLYLTGAVLLAFVFLVITSSFDFVFCLEDGSHGFPFSF